MEGRREGTKEGSEGQRREKDRNRNSCNIFVALNKFREKTRLHKSIVY